MLLKSPKVHNNVYLFVVDDELFTLPHIFLEGCSQSWWIPGKFLVESLTGQGPWQGGDHDRTGTTTTMTTMTTNTTTAPQPLPRAAAHQVETGAMGQEWQRWQRGTNVERMARTRMQEMKGRGGGASKTKKAQVNFSFSCFILFFNNFLVTIDNKNNRTGMTSTCHHPCEPLLTRWIMSAWWQIRWPPSQQPNPPASPCL